MDNNKIGKFIANLRKEKGLTQQELGDKLFVTDKAVSKWERGLSLPDISILEKLAEVLETDIYEILQIEKKKNVNLEKIILEEKEKIKKQIRKKLINILIPICILLFIILFKLLPFGYYVEHLRFSHNTNKLINLGVPKFSFYMQNNEESYSYKNMRGKNILLSEMKSYLSTLEYLPCNDTIYYYDEISDTTIVDYSVNRNLFYNTISYSVKNGNYCTTIRKKEHAEKLGKLNKVYTLYAEKSDLRYELLLGFEEKNDEIKLNASAYVYNYKKNSSHYIERSVGTYELKKDELIYYRTDIIEKDDNVKIPNVSTFVIKNQKLILEDNYLSDYEKSITLK